MIRFLKSVLLLTLLFACIGTAALSAEAETRTERIVYFCICIFLIVVIYAPNRWWFKKG